MRVDDVIAFVRTMERRDRRRARRRGHRGARAAEEGPDFTGVWVGERKIASIGVHVAAA